MFPRPANLWPEWSKRCSYRLSCDLSQSINLTRLGLLKADCLHNEDDNDEFIRDEREEQDLCSLSARKNFIEDVTTSVDCLMVALPAINCTLRKAYYEAKSNGDFGSIQLTSQDAKSSTSGNEGILSTVIGSTQSYVPLDSKTSSATKPSLENGLVPLKKSSLRDQIFLGFQKPLPAPSIKQPLRATRIAQAVSHSVRIAPYTAPRPTKGMETATPPPQYFNSTSAHERASAAWSNEDDNRLWDMRENKKLGWPQIAEFFEDKSPNACRKRFERLKLQKAPDEWEGPKFDALAEIYVQHREELWKRIADELGERDKWQTLEQQVRFRFTFLSALYKYILP